MCKRVEHICQVDPDGWYAPVIGQELVRCKDCKHWVDELCEEWDYVSTDEEFWCKMGERAEG